MKNGISFLILNMVMPHHTLFECVFAEGLAITALAFFINSLINTIKQ